MVSRLLPQFSAWILLQLSSDFFFSGLLSANLKFVPFFPTCQVRVVRFYLSCLVLLVLLLLLSLSSSSSCSTATRDPQCSLSDLHHDHPRPVFPAGPQPRPSTLSVPCRTSTTTIPAQCSLPDLNWAWMVVVEVRQGTLGGDGRGWGPAGNTASIHAKCSLPDLM